MNLYPPWLFLRVRCRAIGVDYQSARVVVEKSLLTRNLNGTTFGGAIFSAADPIYAILYWQRLARCGLATEAWLESAAIRYRRPARSRLTLTFELDDATLAPARAELERSGRYSGTHVVEAVDESGVVCAIAETVAHVRFPGAEPRP